jgi:hypothetical protein
MQLFESLESRSLFSVTPIAAGPVAEPSLAFTIAPLAKVAKLIGTWKGSINVVGVHSQPVTLVINAQNSTGALTGVLTTPADKSIHVKFRGTLKAKGVVTISLAGTHGGGPINGSGTGTLKAASTKITFVMAWKQGGHTFAGTLVLKKV